MQITAVAPVRRATSRVPQGTIGWPVFPVPPSPAEDARLNMGEVHGSLTFAEQKTWARASSKGPQGSCNSVSLEVQLKVVKAPQIDCPKFNWLFKPSQVGAGVG